MIYTLTTNPAIDMNISSLEKLEYSSINRTKDALYTGNGKGINVSRVLKHFGLASTVLGFFGGFTGNFIIDDVKKSGLEIQPILIEETTRINVFVNDGQGEFNLVNEGPLVNSEAQNEMLDFLKAADDMDLLSISGSLPRGIDPDYYVKIFEICKSKNIKVAIDISSKKLKDLLAYRPFIIKPNNVELQEIFGLKLNCENDYVQALNDLHNLGAQNILLTCGDKGLYYFGGDDVYCASMPPVKVDSSACAGDACLAAFMSVFLQVKNNVELALKRACATGADVAGSKGVGKLNRVEKYMPQVEIKKL